MTYRITEHDAFEHDVLVCLDLPTPDAEYERCIDFALDRLTTTPETVMGALLNSAWVLMGGAS